MPLRADLTRIQGRIAELRNQRAREAAERGVECIDCDDAGQGPMGFCHCATGRALAEADEAARYEQRKAAFLAGLNGGLGIPARCGDQGIETYPDQQQPVLDALRAWFAGDETRSLLLVGPFGTGKTTLLADALKQRVRARAQQRDWHGAVCRYGRFVTATGLLQSLRPQPGQDANEDRLLDYQRLPYLAIDDLGAERLTAWGADRLFEIVNERHNQLRPLLLSSNLSLDALAARWDAQIGDESGTRIVNRLFEDCAVIRFAANARNWRFQR